MMLGIATFIIVGLCFYIDQDPQGTMQSIADSYLGPTYFGMWRQ